MTLLIAPSFRLSLLKKGHYLSKHLDMVKDMQVIGNGHKKSDECDEKDLEFLAKQFKGMNYGK
jgi:hypothetical protein